MSTDTSAIVPADMQKARRGTGRAFAFTPSPATVLNHRHWRVSMEMKLEMGIAVPAIGWWLADKSGMSHSQNNRQRHA